VKLEWAFQLSYQRKLIDAWALYLSVGLECSVFFKIPGVFCCYEMLIYNKYMQLNDDGVHLFLVCILQY
jgi:hypothetical protein